MILDFNKGKPLKDVHSSFFVDLGINAESSLLFISDAKIKNTSQVMYFNLNIEGHEVFILYRYVKIMMAQYVRILHTPIAKPRNIQLENKLLKALSKHPQVQEIVTTEADYLEHNIHLPNIQDLFATDFYDNLDDDLIAKVCRGKRRSKIKYTKYKDRIKLRKATQDDYLDIMHIMSTWMKNKEDNFFLINKKTFATVEKKFPMLLQDPFSVYVLTFDDKIIQFEVLADEGDKLAQLVNQTLPYADDYPFDDVINKDIHDYCTKWTHMLTLKEFINHPRYRLINYGYASQYKSGLYNFKEILYSNKRRLVRMKFKKED